MNIYSKLQKMRVELQGMQLKKSGKNTFAGYSYYELGDFLPAINKMMDDNGVCAVVSYGTEYATLTLINAEKPEETITFTSPMWEAVLKGAHPIQNLGAMETYSRRYLYMTAFEIVEADALDATQGAGSPQNGQQQRGTNNKRGNQNGGQRGAQATKQQPQQQKQNTNLPDDISEQLNQQIKMAKQTLNISVAQVVQQLEADTGIKMQDVTPQNAQTILAALDNMINGTLPF